MRKIVVEFCITNMANGSHHAFTKLKKDYDLDVIEYGCLGYCGKCRHLLFALVDNDIIHGENAEELVYNIYQHLDEE
ncbi:DUF1450 domain-containing protein [Cytobacillus sp. FSL M8-0252]